MTHRLRLVGLATIALAATACSGVPASSMPQIVSTVDQSDSTAIQQTISPVPSDDARHIVLKFLTASVDTDDLHQEAKQFLVPRTPWNASTATILSDYHVANPDPVTHTVSVTGAIVGTLDSDGVYSPAAATAAPTAGDRSFAFKMARTAAGWRIKQPPVGLILRQSDFASFYPQRSIYFYNQSETKLVPDLRYSALQGQSLATWLLAQLLNGPQAGPQASAVRRNEISTDLDTARAKVTVGTQTVAVQLPGIGQSDRATATRIAAELAYTMFPVFNNKPLQLTDGPVPVKGLPERFDTSTYPTYAPVPTQNSQQLFYLHDGRLVDAAGHYVAGDFGTSRYHLESVAAGPVALGIRAVAGVSRGGKTLVVGSNDGSVRLLKLPAAATSRPDWSTGGPLEVWLGVGGRLLRAVGPRLWSVPYTATQGVTLPGRSVISVRFSLDGARVAMVLRAKGSSAVWVGQVSRAGNAVQVVDLRQITPADWYPVDVSWTSAVQLRLVDNQPGLSDFAIRSVNVDGSAAQLVPGGDLPGPPEYITSLITDTPLAVTTWVSVGTTLWRDEGGVGIWNEPVGANGQSIFGAAPVYSN